MGLDDHPTHTYLLNIEQIRFVNILNFPTYRMIFTALQNQIFY